MTLNERIANFYDESSPLWLDVWGDHMHHGYYGADGKAKKYRRQAQIDLIEELIDFSKLDELQPKRILDAGCGVGGSSRYLAGRFGAEVLGVTLSPFQAEQGNAFARKEGAEKLVEIRAQDIFTLDDKQGFDAIWSLESAEHMPNKPALLSHFFNLLNPGGTLAMVTWCCRRPLSELTAKELRLLQQICDLYHLPPFVSPDEYLQIAEDLGYQEIKSTDWSTAVAPFWKEEFKTALTPAGLIGLLKSGLTTIKGAWAMQYMQAGFRQKLIKFAVFSMKKPA